MRALHKKLPSSVKHHVVSIPFTREDGSSLTSQLYNAATSQPKHTSARHLSHWERETSEVLQRLPHTKIILKAVGKTYELENRLFMGHSLDPRSP